MNRPAAELVTIANVLNPGEAGLQVSRREAAGFEA